MIPTGEIVSVVLFWLRDLCSRQARSGGPQFVEAVRYIAVFYHGVVVPGALLLLVSGTWLIVAYFRGWAFLECPGSRAWWR